MTGHFDRSEAHLKAPDHARPLPLDSHSHNKNTRVWRTPALHARRAQNKVQPPLGIPAETDWSGAWAAIRGD